MIKTVRRLQHLRKRQIYKLSIAQGFLWVLLIVSTAGAQSYAEHRMQEPINPYLLEAIHTAPYLIVALIGLGHWWNAFYTIRHNVELQEAKLELKIRTQLLTAIYQCGHDECPLHRYRDIGNNLSVVNVSLEQPTPSAADNESKG